MGRLLISVPGDTLCAAMPPDLVPATSETVTAADDCLLVVGGLDHQQVEVLARVLTAPESTKIPIVIATWLPTSAAREPAWLRAQGVTIIQLPISRASLADQLASVRALSDGNWQDVREALATDLVERYASTLRHDLRGVTAAARIYLGALAKGSAPAKGAAKALSKLAGLCERPGSGEVPPKFFEALGRYLRVAAARVGSAAAPRTLKLAMLDDQAYAAGWTTVLRQLDSSVVVTANWNQLLSELPTRSLLGRTLLLDCNLGADHPTGLSLLPALRSASLDLPIVFMTAYDSAEVALWGLRAGANHFFVKEAIDSRDRASLDYYERFEGAAANHPLRRIVDALWRQFLVLELVDVTVKIPGTLYRAAHEIVWGAARVEAFVRLAFYLLYSHFDGMQWWAWSTRAASAAEEQRLGRLAVLSVVNAFPGLQNVAQMEQARVIKDARHGSSVSMHDAVSLLRTGLTQYEQLLGLSPGLYQLTAFISATQVEELRKQQSFDPPGPYTESDLRRDVIPTSKSPRTAHGELSARGVSEVSKGAVLAGAVCDEAVFVVDDRGDQDGGWFEAVGSLFPNAECFKDPAEALSESERASCILLDLHLPNAADGFEVLRTLKVKDPGLPVFVVSAANDSGSAIRALRGGAIDFVGKALQRPRTDAEISAFANGLLTKVAAAAAIGRVLRPRWTRIATVGRGVELPNVDGRLAALSLEVNPIEVPDRLSLWWAAVADEVHFVLAVWQAFEIRSRGRGVLVPIDDWRARELLRLDKIPSLLAWLSANVVERLAQWQVALALGERFDRHRWGRPEGAADRIEIAGALQTATGSAGYKIWGFRNERISCSAHELIDLLLSALEHFSRQLLTMEQRFSRRR